MWKVTAHAPAHFLGWNLGSARGTSYLTPMGLVFTSNDGDVTAHTSNGGGEDQKTRSM
jgi:hypothetical protein